FDSPVEWELALGVPVGEVVCALNNEKRREAPPFAIDALDRRRPFLIARLNCLASSASIGACYYHGCADNAHHEAGLVEVSYTRLKRVLSFGCRLTNFLAQCLPTRPPSRRARS
ncbi:hypothetical protein N658DRAFT_396992, partial [Parathielavia hyrcaniae]